MLFFSLCFYQCYFFRSDLAYFDGLGETIISAGLVKPKPGTVLHVFAPFNDRYDAVCNNYDLDLA